MTTGYEKSDGSVERKNGTRRQKLMCYLSNCPKCPKIPIYSETIEKGSVQNCVVKLI
jgi:hypothetical protein